DPVFEWLDEQGKLTERERRARMAQAIEARQFGLAAYLARPLSDADLERVRLWQKTQADPAKQLEEALSWSDTTGHRAVIRYGLERLSRNEPLETNELWQALDPRFEFSAADRIRIEREIALWAARIHLAEAQDLLDALPHNARTTLTTQWQIRTALWNGDWARVKKFVAALPESQRQQEGWRYWDARAREQVGRLKSAGKIYRSLADTRHYYGFLAADRLGQPYVFHHVATQDNAKIQAALEERPAFQRAREFYMVGLYGRGRTEWTRATKSLKRHDLEQAALLANRWGWTSRAIWSAGKAGVRNDLELRFPLGYRDSIERYAEKAGLPSDWVFGTVRSESLFMPDVVSSAGALGLMQLIPTTGRMVARQNEVPYRNRYSLLDPDTNLALGTAYLASLHEQFGGAVQATAGYNAGPHRVDIWLPEDRVIPADVWVDTIPFLETRNYVHSVMAARVVFGWRETGRATPLADLMPPVEPVTERVALISPTE
ncbi:MAG: transglycosylase SLT domain-containing protein, partial [Gammaproteobacteria bacterium]